MSLAAFTRSGCRGRSIAAFALAASLSMAEASTPPWPEVSFTHIAVRDPLSKVITDFGQTFGLQVSLSPAVLAHDARVDGKITSASPSEFLNQIGATYGLVWFYHDGVLHVSRNSENTTRAVQLPGGSAAGLKEALNQLGVIDPRFGWGEFPDRGVVLVSGPPTYTETIARTIAALPAPAVSQQVRLFRLQHASVDDRVIQYRDKQITTAGVATILRNLANGIGGSGTTLQLMEMASPLRALTPMGGSDQEQPDPAPTPDEQAPRPSSSGGGTAGPRAVIQADSRLNAVIVRDTPDRLSVYEQLISLLDTPSQLIEIEAMIVDINATKVSELGIDWAGRAGRVAGSFGQPALEPTATTLNIVSGRGVNPSTVIADTGNFLMTRISALEGEGNARIVSRPSVLTIDNLGALIDLSETFYIQSTGERVANVVPISVGVTLRVTPHVIEKDGTRAVHLVVDIEDGAIQDLQVQNLPTVRRSTIGTQAVVDENASLVIGGFNTERNVTQLDAVPGLGAVPFFGAFFRKNQTDVQKRERLFLITPRIVPSAFTTVTPS